MTRLSIILLIIFYITNNANASYNIIRDDEIENMITEIATPIIRAARLPKIKIYIVNDHTVNAFTAGGNILFIHSGLITKYSNPSVLQGVIAHEIGHIIAGHVIQRRGQIDNLNKKSMFGTFLGLAGGILTGSPKLLMSIIVSKQILAVRQLMQYSRAHENEADQIAVDLLHKANYSVNGLIKILTKFSQDDDIRMINQYDRTHPSGLWRLNNVKNYIKYTNIKGRDFTDQQKMRFIRCMIKLKAFSQDGKKIIKKYNNFKINDIFARAIAFYRLGHIEKAIKNLNIVIHKEPKNPYLQELKGQIYLESGKFKSAITYYRNTIKYGNNSALVKTQLAISEIKLAQLNRQKYNFDHAINLLNQSLIAEPNNPIAYYYLSLAYAGSGDMGSAKLAKAEQEYIIGNKVLSKKLAKQALTLLKQHQRVKKLKAQDLLHSLTNNPT